MMWDIRYINEVFLIWIIPSTFLSHNVVNWVYTADFAVLAFTRFNFKFLALLLLYIIYIYILVYHLCSISPVFYSYHIIPCIFPSWYCLLSLCLLLYVSAHDTNFNTCSFDLNLSIHVCLSLHATWHSPYHSLESSDSPGSSCLELRA